MMGRWVHPSPGPLLKKPSDAALLDRPIIVRLDRPPQRRLGPRARARRRPRRLPPAVHFHRDRDANFVAHGHGSRRPRPASNVQPNRDRDAPINADVRANRNR